MTARPLVNVFLAVASLGLVAVACSSAPSVEDYCTKLKARYDACPASGGPTGDPVGVDGGTTPTRPPFNQASCERSHKCLTTLFTSTVANEYLACASNTDCATSVSKCDDNAISAGPNATEADTCAKKYAECKTGKGFDDDICVNIRALSSDPLSKVMPCFEKPCDQIKDCVEATVKAIAGDDCDID